jgi:hypothetical protein
MQRKGLNGFTISVAVSWQEKEHQQGQMPFPGKTDILDKIFSVYFSFLLFGEFLLFSI